MHSCTRYFQDYVLPGSIAFSGEAVIEPVSLEEAKKFLQIGYDDDDTLFAMFIKSAREWVEKMTGCSLITRTVACKIEICDSLELPYGPINTMPTVPEGIVKEDGPFTVVKGYGEYSVSYTAGYGSAENPLPASLKLAILQRIAALNENRGDADKSNFSEIAKSSLQPFKRFAQWG
jgi:hypothetical protein